MLTAEMLVTDHELSKHLEAFIARFARHVLTATQGDHLVFKVTEQGHESVTEYSLPRFRFDPELRKLAAGLLKQGRGQDILFLYDDSRSIAADLKQLLDDSARMAFMTVDIHAWPPEAKRWYLENKALLKLFPDI